MIGYLKAKHLLSAFSYCNYLPNLVLFWGRKEEINLKQCVQIQTCSYWNISSNTLKTTGVGREGKTEQLQPSCVTRTEEYHMQPINLSIQWITQISFTSKKLAQIHLNCSKTLEKIYLNFPFTYPVTLPLLQG